MILVDTIGTIYEELFRINITHPGYVPARSITIADEVSLLPDQATRALFRDHDMGYKFRGNIFLCYMRCDLFAPPARDPKIPYVPMPDSIRFRFLLTAGNAFINKTDIIQAGATQVYHFSNRVNAASSLFISHDPSDVNNNDLANVSTESWLSQRNGIQGQRMMM